MTLQHSNRRHVDAAVAPLRGIRAGHIARITRAGVAGGPSEGP